MRLFSLVPVIVATNACLAGEALLPKVVFQTSFEKGGSLPEGWRASFGKQTNFARVQEPVRSGQWAVHIVDASKKESAGLRSPKIEVKPGDPVWASAWFMTKGKTSASIYIEFWDAGGKRMSKQVRSFPARSTGVWRESKGRHRVPDGAAHATVLLYSWSGGVCDGYFDDVAFGTGYQPTHDRTPLPPAKVKHPCGPYSTADIERAGRNVQEHLWAQRLLSGFRRSAQFWLNIPDSDLPKWIPELTPFRVVNCPKCGATWSYCWGNIGKGQFRCKRCSTEYPNEDYPETHVEHLITPTGKSIAHPYYENAKGEKFRLSGYSRYQRVGRLAYLGNMGRCYALTGERKYADKAVKVMRRLAEVYPDWVAHDWRKIYEGYSNLQSGKMCGWKLSDCTILLEVCLCYDLIYDSGALTGEDKVAIENSVFRELGELLLPVAQHGCCFNDGPFQMSAAAYAGVLLGEHRLVQWALEPPGGFRGFVRDYFFRDGQWQDGSPSYEAMTLSKLYLLPEILQGYSDPPTYTGADRYDNLDVFGDPLLKKIHVAGLYNMFIDRRQPAINDASKRTGHASRHAEVNYYWYPTQRNLGILNWVFRGDVQSSGSEYSLFRRDPDRQFDSVEPICLSNESILRPGLGWGILREGKGQDRTDLVLDYGAPCGWHGHPDRLNFILWANGREAVTDLGYLGARHHFRPWMAHGVCHNLVMVDGKDQAREPGKLILFQPGERVQAIVAEAPDVYSQCSKYERSMVLVTPALGVQYVVDVFRVAGGEQHDYSFHGDGAVFNCPALRNAKPHNAELGPKEGGYGSFEHVQSLAADGQIIADWRFGDQDRKAANIGVRLRMVAAAGELINAKGPNLRDGSRPFDKPMLDYVIQRRPGPKNTFVSIVEPLAGAAVVTKVDQVRVDNQTSAAEFGTVAVKVTHCAGVDYIAVATAGSRRIALRPDNKTTIEAEARLVVVSLDAAGQLRFLWLADGRYVRWNDVRVETDPTFAGKITRFDESGSYFVVDSNIPVGRLLSGQPFIAQKRYDGAYTVDRVEAAEDGTRVHLRHEPIMKVEEGEGFRLPTYAMLSARRTRDGALYEAACAVRVTLPTREGLGHVSERTGSGPWVQRSERPEGGTVTLDWTRVPARPDRTSLLLAGSAVSHVDADGPASVVVEPANGEAKADGADLRFVSSPTIRIAFQDRSQVASIETRLLGARVGSVQGAASIARQGGDRWDVVVNTAGLAEDDYRVVVVAHDGLGNRSDATVLFQNKGFVIHVMDMRIAEDSGHDSKPLKGLGTQFYRGKKVGDFIVYEFELEAAGRYRIELVFTQAHSYGQWQLSLDGKRLGKPVDGYAPSVVALGGKVSLGSATLEAGAHRLRVDVVGRHPKSTAYLVGLGHLTLKPE